MKQHAFLWLSLGLMGCASKQDAWPATEQSLVEQPAEAPVADEPTPQPVVAFDDLTAASGLYEGTYTCPQGKTGMTLELYVDAIGNAWGVFNLFSIPESNYEFSGSFQTRGKVEPDGSFRLDAEESDWIVQPGGFVTIDLTGQLEPEPAAMNGEIVQPECSVFEATRTK